MKNLLPILLCLSLAPATALAEKRCEHSAGRAVQLDLEGVRTVRVETGQHLVRLTASASGQHRIDGRACASSAALLDELELVQQRQGDTLVVSARGPAPRLNLTGRSHGWMELSGTVPDDVLVQLVVGSGDAFLDGGAAASVDVGSGDARLRGIRGAVTAKVGSGDIEVAGAGALKVLSIGSGDVEARDIGGDVEVGSIGSGDFELEGARGDVGIGSIGSGDASVARVGGTVRVGSVGSGDLEVRGAAALKVDSVGSGDVRHRDVPRVDVPRRD